MKVIEIIALLMVLSPINICIAKEWRGIVPLKSTRADVERVLGPPDDALQSTYYLAEEVVRVEYSKHGCKPALKGWPIPPREGWNVPPGTVLSVIVTPRKQVPLATLSIDLTKFKKVNGDHDVPTHFLYVNEEVGLILASTVTVQPKWSKATCMARA